MAVDKGVRLIRKSGLNTSSRRL